MATIVVADAAPGALAYDHGVPNAIAVAAAQTVSARGDVASNTAQHARLARRAADLGARVVVFPELSLTGYELDVAAQLAFDDDDPRLAPLRAVAAELDVVLVVGAPVRREGGLRIGAIALAPDGTCEVVTKRCLGAFPESAGAGGPVPPAERTVFEPGGDSPLVRWGGTAAAVAICADANRAEHASEAAGRGAACYLASLFITPDEVEEHGARFAGYARTHRMLVAMANHGGPTGGLPGGGGSAIWTPDGTRIVQLDPAGAGVAVARDDGGRWRALAAPLDPA